MRRGQVPSKCLASPAKTVSAAELQASAKSRRTLANSRSLLRRRSFRAATGLVHKIIAFRLGLIQAPPLMTRLPMKNFLRILTASSVILLAARTAQAQPANDNFANAWRLSGTSVTTNGSTAQPANATKQTG